MAESILSFSDKSGRQILEGVIKYSDGDDSFVHDAEAATVEIQDGAAIRAFQDTDELQKFLTSKGVEIVRYGERGDLFPVDDALSLERFVEKHRSWWSRAKAEIAEIPVSVSVDQAAIKAKYGPDTYKNLKKEAQQEHVELYEALKRLGDNFRVTTLVDSDLSAGGLSEEEKAIFWERLKDRFPDSDATKGVLKALIETGAFVQIGAAGRPIDSFSLAEKDYHEVGGRLKKKEGDGVEGEKDVALGSIPSTPQNVEKQINKIKKKINDLLAILKLLIALGDTDMLALYLELYSLRKKLDGAKVSAHVADIQKVRDENIEKLLKKAQDYEEKAARSENREEVTKYKNKAELIRNVIEGLRTLDKPLQMLADGMLEDAQQHSKTAEFARNMRSRDKGKFYG